MSDNMKTLKDLYNVHQQLGKDEVILDVRRPEEFAEGHIKTALNIPLDQVVDRAEELKRYKAVYIHCKRGGRAKTAYEALSQKGLNNLICIHDAGMDAWIESGYPFEK